MQGSSSELLVAGASLENRGWVLAATSGPYRAERGLVFLSMVNFRVQGIFLAYYFVLYEVACLYCYLSATVHKVACPRARAARRSS